MNREKRIQLPKEKGPDPKRGVTGGNKSGPHGSRPFAANEPDYDPTPRTPNRAKQSRG